MQILIADDEELVRYSLKSMLQEIGLSPATIVEVENGEELVASVKHSAPDLAFVDIKMPVYNGLDAIKMAQTHSDHTQWVLLTSYSDFKYAKEAVELGALSYLLKPVSPEELEGVLEKTQERFHSYLKHQNQEFENLINALLHSTQSLDVSLFPFKEQSGFAASMIFIDSHLNQKSQLAYQTSFCQHFRQEISKLLEAPFRSGLITIPTGEILCIRTWDKTCERTDELFQDYSSSLHTLIQEFKQESALPTIFETRFCGSLPQLLSELSELKNYLHLRINLGIGQRLDWQQLLEATSNLPEDLRTFSQELHNLSEAYKENSILNYTNHLNTIDARWRTHSKIFRQQPGLQKFLKFAFHYQDCEERPWIEHLHTMGEGLVEKASENEQQGQTLVKQVLDFLEQNYMQNIGIAQIADMLHITPNYLSSLFHKETGITFIKYLTRIRILKAKELLADPTIKVAVVAQTVGYTGHRHFSKLFKEHCGCLPSEYQKKLDGV